LEQLLIDDATDQRPTCLHACAHGRHFKHTL